VGACASTGIATCTAGGWGNDTCMPGTPMPEICNGIDDDCDGAVDDGGNELCNDLNSCTIDVCNGAQGCSNTFDTRCLSGLTNTEFCQLPADGFNLAFLQDGVVAGTSTKSFLLNSSQPGQFYYNAFLTGPDFAANATVDLYINIPYPFVTQGATPIQLHDGVGFTSSNCFIPSPSILGCVIETAGGNFSTSGHPIITIGDYTPQNVGAVGGMTTIHVSGCNVPASGMLYVTVHLDYGLKKTNGWTSSATGTAIHLGTGASPFSDGTVNITNPQLYDFSWADASGPTKETTAKSKNTFKSNPGVAGQTKKSPTLAVQPDDPVPGVRVELWGPTKKLLQTTTTDADGFYQFLYKHTGKAADYTIKLPAYNKQQVVTLKANAFKLAFFEDLP
jgi:hypothetical protein